MKRPDRSTLVAGAVAVVAVIAVLIFRDAQPHPSVAGLTRGALARTMGDPASKLWIVEYLDYECASCREASEWLGAYLDKHPGAFFLQMRHYPLRAHVHAVDAAVSAECAARQRKFWPYHKLLLSRQDVWSRLERPKGLWETYASEAGLDVRRWRECLSDERVRDQVLQESIDARAVGVEGTPTIFVGGETVIGAALLPEKVEEALRRLDKEGTA